jgi:glycosyltransferase involved in cell wall biosynthesis
MHFPIDITCYEQAYQNRSELRRRIRLQYNIAPGEMVISMIGKLVPWKNQDQLIEALHILEKRSIYLHLFLVGTGDMQQEWEQKAKTLTKSKVHFTGFIDINELPAYYAATDIYVHAASVEPHSLAISEAIYMGCPAIISDRCGSYGTTDDIQDNKNGYVYQFGNLEDLASKIELLASNEITRQAFGRYSHELGVQFQKKSHFQTLDKLVAIVNEQIQKR